MLRMREGGLFVVEVAAAGKVFLSLSLSLSSSSLSHTHTDKRLTLVIGVLSADTITTSSSVELRRE